jgi:hypothetical protein
MPKIFDDEDSIFWVILFAVGITHVPDYSYSINYQAAVEESDDLFFSWFPHDYLHHGDNDHVHFRSDLKSLLPGLLQHR